MRSPCDPDLEYAVLARPKTVACPCGEAGLETDECEHCVAFRCADCRRWTPWDDSADDDMPDHCSDCWAEAHPEPAQ